MQHLVTSVRHLFVLAIALSILNGNRASAIQIWLSDVGTTNGAVTVSDMDVTVDRGVLDQELFIWGRPDADQTLKNISLNIEATTPGVIEFTDIEMHNPLLREIPGVDPFHRYEFVAGQGGVSKPTIQADSIAGIAGFTVANNSGKFGQGLGPATRAVDPLYDVTADAFLLATVTYNALEVVDGETELFLQIGSNGLNQEGQSSRNAEVVFGGGSPPDPALNANSNRNTNSATADGTIHVSSLVPSPWQNPVDRLDVDDNLSTEPRDALFVINEINQRTISEPRNGLLPDASTVPGAPPPYLDVSGDFAVTPLDALIVINALNNPGARVAATAAGSAASLALAAAAPEPSALVTALLGIAGVLLGTCGGRRRPSS